MQPHLTNNYWKILSILLVRLAVVAHLSWPLNGEAFGNNSLSIPRLGMSFYDLSLLPHKKPWGLDHQWTVGTSFSQAINYQWWWVLETHFGFGKLTVQNTPFISSFAGGAGVRFNIFQDDFRPHTGLMVHYVQLLGDATRDIPLNLGWPIFVGIKPYFGLEWLFYSEMALSIDCAYGLYVNINEPFRRILYASTSFAVYF